MIAPFGTICPVDTVQAELKISVCKRGIQHFDLILNLLISNVRTSIVITNDMEGYRDRCSSAPNPASFIEPLLNLPSKLL